MLGTTVYSLLFLENKDKLLLFFFFLIVEKKPTDCLYGREVTEVSRLAYVRVGDHVSQATSFHKR